MKVPPEMITGLEGKFGRSGAFTTRSGREPGKKQSPLMVKRGAAREHDLGRAQKDHTMRTRAGL